LPLDAAGKQFLPALVEFLVQLGNEQERLRRKNFLAARRNRCREGQTRVRHLYASFAISLRKAVRSGFQKFCGAA
jgi:hypothetical protein